MSLLNSESRRKGSLGNLFCLIRESVAGGDQDFTKGDLRRGIFVLAIPMVLEMFMESVFAIVDIFFVEELGARAVAVVGLTESVQTIVFAIGIGLSMGVTAMVARRVGENDIEGARQAAGQAILLGIVAAVPSVLTGLLAASWVLRLMGAESAVVALGSRYTSTMLVGNLFLIQLFLINAIFRGAGKPDMAMRSLWLANGINILLDPCLIFGLGPFPEWGVTGAAVASTIGRGCGVAYQVFHLLGGTGAIRISPRDLVPRLGLSLRLVRVSVWGVFQFLVATSSWIFLVRIVARFGSEVVAGYTIAIRILLFTFLPAWGFSNAAATLVGQNLGAGQPKRAERAVWLTAHVNGVFMTTVGILFALTPTFWVGLLTRDPLIAQHAALCIRVVAIGYPFYAYGMVLVQSFNGAGDTLSPMLINLFCYWTVQVGFAWSMAITLGLGPIGVYFAIVVGETMMTLVSYAVFRRGRWKAIVI